MQTNLDLNDLLKAMEEMDAPLEEEFEFTNLLYKLEKTCSTHHVGEKSLEQMRYICPICKIPLDKTPINES